MDYQDVINARRNAEREIELADKAVRDAAQLIANRLRSSGVQGWILEDLKRELKDFNMKTHGWNDK